MSGSTYSALPPSSTTPELDGDFPNALADRVLQLHSRSQGASQPSPTAGRLRSLGRIVGSRASSGNDDNEHKASALSQDEQQNLLNDSDRSDDTDDEDQATHARSKRSRSSSGSRTRHTPWYKKASPMLLMPGTLVFALSIGMTASAKLDIYTQLICQAIHPEDVPLILRPHPKPAPGSDLPPPAPMPDLPPTTHIETQLSRYVDSFVTQAVADSSSEEESWKKRCYASTDVAKGVSSLATILTLIMGCLSAFTTGWWGVKSDCYGRRPVLSLALLGMCLMDVVFLITVNFYDVVSYRFLFLGPVLDGLLGGLATAQATMNAYISDCTEAGSRARVYSMFGGLMFAGFAVGPILGALLLHHSHSVLLPFYIALALHLCYFFSVASGIIPESLSKDRQHAARLRHREEVAKMVEAEEAADRKARESGTLTLVRVKATRLLLRPWSFLKPLQMLLPRKRGMDEKEDDKPVMDTLGRTKTGWDFSLVKIGITMTCFGLFMSLIQFKMLYAQHRFGWDAENLGYYISFLGFSRVIVLLGILPLLIKRFRKDPPLPPMVRPVHDTAGDPTIETDEQKAWDREATWLRVVHDSHFDLRLARISIVVEMCGYLAIALNGGSTAKFLAATALSCLGGGANAAIQSLALAHASPRDAGRVFACLSVLSSVASSIVGPLLFGTVYYRSIGAAQEAIFWVAVGILGIALLTTLTIRLRKSESLDDESREALRASVRTSPRADAGDFTPQQQRQARTAVRRARDDKNGGSAYSLRTVIDGEDEE